MSRAHERFSEITVLCHAFSDKLGRAIDAPKDDRWEEIEDCEYPLNGQLFWARDNKRPLPYLACALYLTDGSASFAEVPDGKLGDCAPDQWQNANLSAHGKLLLKFLQDLG